MVVPAGQRRFEMSSLIVRLKFGFVHAHRPPWHHDQFSPTRMAIPPTVPAAPVRR
jgi:hypothetical protein